MQFLQTNHTVGNICLAGKPNIFPLLVFSQSWSVHFLGTSPADATHTLRTLVWELPAGVNVDSCQVWLVCCSPGVPSGPLFLGTTPADAAHTLRTLVRELPVVLGVCGERYDQQRHLPVQRSGTWILDSVSACLSLYLCLPVPLSIFSLPLSLCVFLSVCLSLCLWFCLSLFQSLCLSVCLSLSLQFLSVGQSLSDSPRSVSVFCTILLLLSLFLFLCTVHLGRAALIWAKWSRWPCPLWIQVTLSQIMTCNLSGISAFSVCWFETSFPLCIVGRVHVYWWVPVLKQGHGQVLPVYWTRRVGVYPPGPT